MKMKLKNLSLTIILGWVATLNLTAATFTVTQTGSLGAGSLRQAVLDAEANPGPDIIEFAAALAGQTILLAHVGDSGNGFSALGINTEIEIRNTTGSNITIARDSNSNYAMRIFNVRASGSLTLVNVTINNGLLTAVGGVNIASAGTFTARGCTITGAYGDNGASSGGGGLLVSAGTATLINCTITANHCRTFGGGVVCAFGASLNVLNCTITGNTGGGVKDLVGSGTTMVRNTILDDNSFTPANGSSNNLAATLALPAALAANGGPTATMAIGVASPAVGGGVYDPAVLTDQRGKVRPQFGTPDIGAYELTAFDTGQTVVNTGGAYWYLGAPVLGNDLSIYREVLGQVPVNVGGAASLIGLANDGTVLVKNANGGVYARIGSTNGLGNSWQLLTSVTAGDGATWFLGADGIGSDFYIYRWAAGGLPTYVTGLATQISVLTDGSIAVRNSGGTSFFRVGSNAGIGSAWQIIASTPPTLTGPTRLGNGSFRFSFANIAGASFTVLTSTNLALPLSNWTSLGAPSENPAGTYQFTDSAATNSPGRFYRVTSP